MSEAVFLLLLYTSAAVVLVLEIFIPSYGVLSVVGFGTLIAAIAKTFEYYGATAGGLAILGSVILLPVAAYTAVKIWPHTKIGRLIAPPNPVYTERDLGVDRDSLRSLVGRRGRTLTPLRPIGTCEFDGRRVQCVCESGMIDAGVPVQAVGLKGRDLQVAPADDPTSA